MRKSFIVSFVFGILVCTALSVSADWKPSDWQFKKTIRVPQASSGQYVQVTIDKQIYAKSPNLADLRVVDSTGTEVPYQLVVKDSTGADQYYPSRLLDVSTSGGQTNFTLDLGSRGSIHDRIIIETPSSNFRRQVSVYASDTNSNWKLLTDTGYIYNFYDTRVNFNAGSGEVRYPQSTARYIHVVIGSGEGSTVSVSGAQVYRYDTRQAQEEGLSVPLFVSQNTEEKSTELTADLGAPVPTHSITLGATDSNFSRRVVIQASDDNASWRLVGQGYIFKVATSLFTGSELKISYPETAARYIRAIVFNEDNRALGFNTSASFQSVIRTIIFQTEPNTNYTLYYGSQAAYSPRYDFARIFQYIESENIPQATLGGAEENASYVAPAAPVVPFTDKYPYVLNTALVLLVLIILVFLFFYARKVYGTSR